MRIIVVSDTHGHHSAMEGIWSAQPHADRYIHLGDGMGDIELFRRNHPACDLYSVKGNTDFLSADPEIADMEILGHRILYTHGHTFFVKRSPDALRQYALRNGYDVVLFGHTHQPSYQFVNGIHYLNPGSAVQGVRYRFGIVDITLRSVICVTSEIQRTPEGTSI